MKMHILMFLFVYQLEPLLRREIMLIAPAIGIMLHPILAHQPLGAVHFKVGITIGSIGKLHYRNADDDVGLDFQKIPMHVVDGIGDVLGCVREPLPKRWKALSMAENIGPGETNYNIYDRQVAKETVNWLATNGNQERPWVLFVSMVAPHFLIDCTKEFYDLYDHLNLMPTKARENPEHPWHHAMRKCQIMDNFTLKKRELRWRHITVWSHLLMTWWAKYFR